MERVQELTQKFVDYSKNLVNNVTERNIPLVTFLNDLLPEYYQFYNNVLAAFNQEAPAPISCGPNCGACCSTLVQISPLEAVNIWFHIKKEYTNEQLTRIFEQLQKRVNILNKISNFEKIDHDELCTLYLKQRIPCLFLTSDQNCSIHHFRPAICRNHHVVTPPEWCDDIEHIERVKIWRHPNLVSLDVLFQQKLSTYFIGVSSMGSMQQTLAMYYRFCP
ncbi:YkgJ family cysteine cluster protein [candidate division KSB1 bacterium]|nr:YkgJ family cysteine cluster protein [candidate division KSB1 bacterium]